MRNASDRLPKRPIRYELGRNRRCCSVFDGTPVVRIVASKIVCSRQESTRTRVAHKRLVGNLASTDAALLEIHSRHEFRRHTYDGLWIHNVASLVRMRGIRDQIVASKRSRTRSVDKSRRPSVSARCQDSLRRWLRVREKVARGAVEFNATLRLEIIDNCRNVVVAVDHQKEGSRKQHATLKSPSLCARNLPLVFEVIRQLINLVRVGRIHMGRIHLVPVRRRLERVCVEPLESSAHDRVTLWTTDRFGVHKQSSGVIDQWIVTTLSHQYVDAHLEGSAILLRLVCIARASDKFMLHRGCVKLEIVDKILRVCRCRRGVVWIIWVDDRIDVNRSLFPVVLQIEHDLQIVSRRRLEVSWRV